MVRTRPFARPLPGAGFGGAAHRRERRRQVGGGAVRQPRVDAGRGVKLGIGRAQDRGHGPAGRKARHIDAGRVDGELRHDGAGDAREDRRLAFVALLVGEIEPVPAGRQIGARRLLRDRRR